MKNLEMIIFGLIIALVTAGLLFSAKLGHEQAKIYDICNSKCYPYKLHSVSKNGECYCDLQKAVMP